MSDLVVDFIVTLDGCASGEGWPGFWGLEGPEYLAFLDQPSEKAHTTLMGANTYRLMSSFTPDESGDDGLDDLAQMPKIVFSSTFQEPVAWPNTTVIAGDPIPHVRRMKEHGVAMRTLGSLTLCRTLLAAGLVDRFRLVVFPLITGRTGQERIFDGYPDLSLELIGTRTFDGRLQLLEYRPTVLTKAPLED